MRSHEQPELRVGSAPCSCPQPRHTLQKIVVTGGPGSGKTAILEVASRSYCRHVAILPEAASIIFTGGFPRHTTPAGLRATQRAIFAVQRQIETLVEEEAQVAVALCDRGTVDGAAYWPDGPADFWMAMAADEGGELARYRTVVHLRVPDAGKGYQTDSIRTETQERAGQIDQRIEEVWARHPSHEDIPADRNFADKARHALAAIAASVPSCCGGLDSVEEPGT